MATLSVHLHILKEYGRGVGASKVFYFKHVFKTNDCYFLQQKASEELQSNSANRTIKHVGRKSKPISPVTYFGTQNK